LNFAGLLHQLAAAVVAEVLDDLFDLDN